MEFNGSVAGTAPSQTLLCPVPKNRQKSQHIDNLERLSETVARDFRPLVFPMNQSFMVFINHSGEKEDRQSRAIVPFNQDIFLSNPGVFLQGVYSSFNLFRA
jgi:hypothetical protein